jgi:hypothetical protein
MQKTSENRDTANELAVDIHILIDVIKRTVDTVQGNMNSMRECLGEGQNNSLKLEEYKPPELFGKMIDELVECASIEYFDHRDTNRYSDRDLKCVLAIIIEEQDRGFLSRFFRAGDVESKFKGAKEKLENAVNKFKVHNCLYFLIALLLLMLRPR